MKNKGQRDNRNPIETLAHLYVRLPRWSVPIWMGFAAGSNSPQPHPYESAPANDCTRLRGISSGMSQRQGWKPAVILALRPEESKGQNNLFK